MLLIGCASQPAPAPGRIPSFAETYPGIPPDVKVTPERPAPSALRRHAKDSAIVVARSFADGNPEVVQHREFEYERMTGCDLRWSVWVDTPGARRFARHTARDARGLTPFVGRAHRGEAFAVTAIFCPPKEAR